MDFGKNVEFPTTRMPSGRRHRDALHMDGHQHRDCPRIMIVGRLLGLDRGLAQHLSSRIVTAFYIRSDQDLAAIPLWRVDAVVAERETWLSIGCLKYPYINSWLANIPLVILVGLVEEHSEFSNDPRVVLKS